MRTNYVLIDFENLQPELLESLNHEHFRVLVFVGANQNKVPLDFAARLQPLGTRGRYIQIAGSGRNALDFHIAFYIGEIAAGEPGAFFHIISGDTGFAPLLRHLKDRKIFARQYQAVSEIPHVRALLSKTVEARAAFVLSSLDERVGRPASTKTLLSVVTGLFPGGLADGDARAVVEHLVQLGAVKLVGTSRVEYPQLAPAAAGA